MALTIQLTKTTLLFGLILLATGYFIGNTLPITGDFGGQTLDSGETQVRTGDTQQRQQGSGSGSVDLSVDDDPTLGDSDAPVKVYEFSDFQCPFCRRAFEQAVVQLETEYVDTGKVLFVYKDFPLSQIHPSAGLAAEYAECAQDQGKWKEAHDAIFEEQGKLGQGTIQFGDSELQEWLGTTSIDMEKLSQCVSSGKHQSEVSADQQEGVSAGVSGTPTFFIGNDEEGYTKLVGAQPYSRIKSAVEQYL